MNPIRTQDQVILKLTPVCLVVCGDDGEPLTEITPELIEELRAEGVRDPKPYLLDGQVVMEMLADYSNVRGIYGSA